MSPTRLAPNGDGSQVHSEQHVVTIAQTLFNPVVQALNTGVSLACWRQGNSHR